MLGLFVVGTLGLFGRGPLAVVGVRTVLAKEMFVQERALHRPGSGVQSQGLAGQADHMFEHHGIMDGFWHGLTPSEWTMAGNQHRGAGERIAPGKGFDDYFAGFLFVICLDFLGPHQSGARDRAMKIIGMGGA